MTVSEALTGPGQVRASSSCLAVSRARLMQAQIEFDSIDVRAESPVCRCGDGQPDSAGPCDDENSCGGDGCDGKCQAETGYVCSGSPSVCTAVVPCKCGDVIQEVLTLCTANDACSEAQTIQTYAITSDATRFRGRGNLAMATASDWAQNLCNTPRYQTHAADSRASTHTTCLSCGNSSSKDVWFRWTSAGIATLH